MTSNLSTAPSALAAQAPVEEDEKSVRTSRQTSPDHYDEANEDLETDAQEGVKTIEGITRAWNKKWLAIAYVCFWSIYLVNGFQSSITGNLSPYILSDFSEAPLVTVISTVSSVLSGALLLPIARMLNIWDRGHGFALMGCLATLGLILSAATTNIYMYAAAQVFYNIGFLGLVFSVDVCTLDTSKLRDRGLAYAFTSSPYIITAFAGPKAAEKFNDTNWRWGYGTFAIVLPVICAPLYGTLLYNKHKARKQGYLSKAAENSVHRTAYEWVKWFVIEFDLIGVILFAGGLALFLLPFNIAGSASSQWASAHIIAMLVVGFVMLVGFGFFEAYLAPKPFIPWKLLVSRTVLGMCVLLMAYNISYYCWAIYFSEYLQVVYNRSLSDAGTLLNIFSVINTAWLLVLGYGIRRSGRYRWILWWAVPVEILFQGLLVYFRGQGTNIGYIVMCLIFMAMAGGVFILVGQVAVLAAASHQDAASSLAMLNVAGTIGSAIGSSVSGAIWTSKFPEYLQKFVPEELWEDIYGSLDVQLSYEYGSDIRNGIAHAYEDTQRLMLAAGVCFLIIPLVGMFVIQDHKLDRKQVKGIVF